MAPILDGEVLATSTPHELLWEGAVRVWYYPIARGDEIEYIPDNRVLPGLWVPYP